MNAAEYITSTTPSRPTPAPPYRQSPGVRWALITNTSMPGGVAGLVPARRTADGLHRISLRSEAGNAGKEPDLDRLRGGMEERIRKGSIRLFGPIIERDGKFKFVTYASDY